MKAQAAYDELEQDLDGGRATGRGGGRDGGRAGGRAGAPSAGRDPVGARPVPEAPLG